MTEIENLATEVADAIDKLVRAKVHAIIAGQARQDTKPDPRVRPDLRPDYNPDYEGVTRSRDLPSQERVYKNVKIQRSFVAPETRKLCSKQTGWIVLDGTGPYEEGHHCFTVRDYRAYVDACLEAAHTGGPNDLAFYRAIAPELSETQGLL